MTKKERVQRNEPCTCGSGIKWKKCCGKPRDKTWFMPYKNMSFLHTDAQTMAVAQFTLRFGFIPSPAQLLAFMDGDEAEIRSIVVRAVRRPTGSSDTAERFVRAINQTGYLITPRNQHKVPDEVKKAWTAAMQE